MRIILDYEGGHLFLQLRAAHAALNKGIKVGEIWGFSYDGYLFGVKRNKASVRVYPSS